MLFKKSANTVDLFIGFIIVLIIGGYIIKDDDLVVEGNGTAELTFFMDLGIKEAVCLNVHRSPSNTGLPRRRINKEPIPINGRFMDTEFTDIGLEVGKEYFYMVTVVRRDGTEDGFANIVSVKAL